MAEDTEALEAGINATLSYLETHLEKHGEDDYDLENTNRIDLLKTLRMNEEAILDLAEDILKH